MSVAYQVGESRVGPAGWVHVEFSVRNESREPWRASDHTAISYHIYDADTGTLLSDGPRLPIAHDLKPGEAFPVKLDLEVPAGDGRYRVLFSPMREGVCWYYDRGWSFLLLEAATRDDVTSVGRLRVATRSTLRWERYRRALAGAFVWPFQTIWQNRGLIRVMVRRDILGRYRGSFGGSFWTVINPLLLMLTYFFVFGYVLQAKFPGDPSRTAFALRFLAGMLPWLAFSEAVGRAPSVMLEHRNFVRKLVFAIETLPVNLVASAMVSGLSATLLFAIFRLVVKHGLPESVLWLPVLLIPQVLLTAGLCWFLAALGVFVRDLGQILGYVLTLWFFITPICYPETALPQEAAVVLKKNPIFILVHAYRDIFLDNRAPQFGPMWKLWVLSFAVFVLGYAWFHKLRKSFADII